MSIKAIEGRSINSTMVAYFCPPRSLPQSELCGGHADASLRPRWTALPQTTSDLTVAMMIGCLLSFE